MPSSKDAAPAQVGFDFGVRGYAFALFEDFPLAGGPVVKCLVIQPEDGGAPTRVPADSAEADRLRERYPALKGVA